MVLPSFLDLFRGRIGSTDGLGYCSRFLNILLFRMSSKLDFVLVHQRGLFSVCYLHMLGNPRDFPVSIKSPKHPKSIVLGATISRFHLPSSSLTQMWNSRHVWITVDQFSERGQSLIVFPYGEHLLNVYSSPQRDVTRIIDHQFHPRSSKFYLNLVV